MCAESLVVPKKLLEFIKPTGKSSYTIHDLVGIKLLNRLQTDFSQF